MSSLHTQCHRWPPSFQNDRCTFHILVGLADIYDLLLLLCDYGDHSPRSLGKRWNETRELQLERNRIMISDNIRTRKLEDNKFKTTHLIVDSKNGVYILPIPVYIILFSSNKKNTELFLLTATYPNTQSEHLPHSLSGPSARNWLQTSPALLVPFVL